MCLSTKIINLLINVALIISICVPTIYLIIKIKKLKLINFLFAIFMFLILFSISKSFNFIKICTKKDNTKPVIKEKSTKPSHENNPNYIGVTEKGYTIEKINGAYYIDGVLIVNKTFVLDKDFAPQNTYQKINADLCNLCINNEAYENWLKMKNDATALGLNINITSGYRSYTLQEKLYNNYIKRDGKKATDKYSARPGHSEHQTSFSFDLNSIDDSFTHTNEGIWVSDNAFLYGFIIRYPKGKEHITGYKYEPWHLRYVGTNLANKLYNNGNWITLEEYFGIDSKYQTQ